MIREIDATDPASALASAKGRMVVKVEQALKAIEHGVGQVIFADARVEHPIQRALAGEGTRIGVPVCEPVGGAVADCSRAVIHSAVSRR